MGLAGAGAGQRRHPCAHSGSAPACLASSPEPPTPPLCPLPARAATATAAARARSGTSGRWCGGWAPTTSARCSSLSPPARARRWAGGPRAAGTGRPGGWRQGTAHLDDWLLIAQPKPCRWHSTFRPNHPTPPTPPRRSFRHLQPPLTIHKVDCGAGLLAAVGGRDVDRLPTASTCSNTLKLVGGLFCRVVVGCSGLVLGAALGGGGGCLCLGAWRCEPGRAAGTCRPPASTRACA